MKSREGAQPEGFQKGGKETKTSKRPARNGTPVDEKKKPTPPRGWGVFVVCVYLWAETSRGGKAGDSGKAVFFLKRDKSFKVGEGRKGGSQAT